VHLPKPSAPGKATGFPFGQDPVALGEGVVEVGVKEGEEEGAGVEVEGDVGVDVDVEV